MVGDHTDTWPEPGGEPTRRTILRSLGAVGVGMALAGCSGIRSHDYAATPVRLDETTKPEEYELRTADPIEQRRDVELDDNTVEATITSHLVAYQREGSGFLDSVALGTLSTPLVEEGGQSLNPLAELSTERLLRDPPRDDLLEQWDLGSEWARDPVAVQTDPGELFDEQVTVQTFAGVAATDEFVLLNVVRHEHRGDLVFAGTARSKPVESPEGPLVGPEGHVSQSQVDETVRQYGALLPHFVHAEPAATATPGSSMDAATEEFLGLQETLGESLAAAADVNVEFATAMSNVETMIYGVLLAGELDRFRDAPLPEGFDRRAIFSTTAQDVDDAELPDRPETVAEWTRHVERFETLRAESNRRRNAVADAADELRRYIEQNVSLFAGRASHDQPVPLHPRFAEEPMPLPASVWTIYHDVAPLKHSHPAVHAGFEDVVKTVATEVSETATETADGGNCPPPSIECSDARITIVIGYGGWYNGFGHAWIRHTATYRSYVYSGPDCEKSQFLPYPTKIVSESWGWYGGNDFRDDSDNEIQCEVPVWTGECSSAEGEPPTPYEQFLEQLEMDLDHYSRTWKPNFNCLDWAFKVAREADEDRVIKLSGFAEGWHGHHVPDNLCEYTYVKNP